MGWRNLPRTLWPSWYTANITKELEDYLRQHAPAVLDELSKLDIEVTVSLEGNTGFFESLGAALDHAKLRTEAGYAVAKEALVELFATSTWRERIAAARDGILHNVGGIKEVVVNKVAELKNATQRNAGDIKEAMIGKMTGFKDAT